MADAFGASLPLALGGAAEIAASPCSSASLSHLRIPYTVEWRIDCARATEMRHSTRIDARGRQGRPMYGSRTLNHLANAQHGVLTYEQLRGLGMSDRTLRRLCDSGRLDRLHHRVFAVGHRQLSPSGVRLAAALSVSRAEALVARRSAGNQVGIVAMPPKHGLVEVAVASDRGSRRGDVHLLRLPSLTEEDRIVSDGVPCTSVARTLLDLAGVLTEHQLGRAVREAEFRGLLDRTALASTIARVARPRGVCTLRELLAIPPARGTETRLEGRLLTLLLDTGLKHPELQHRFVIGSPTRQIRVDFYWPEARLVVEADEPHHQRPAFQAEDARRDEGLSELGVLVHRVPQCDLDTAPLRVAKDTFTLYTSRVAHFQHP